MDLPPSQALEHDVQYCLINLFLFVSKDVGEKNQVISCKCDSFLALHGFDCRVTAVNLLFHHVTVPPGKCDAAMSKIDLNSGNVVTQNSWRLLEFRSIFGILLAGLIR